MAIDYYRDYVQHPSVSRDLKYFEAKFDARIEDSKEYNQYIRRMPSFEHGWDKLSFDMNSEVVPMKCIHLTRDNLERLIREQEHMERLQVDAESGKRLWSKEREESMIRNSNPAVEKAYRNYQMLLELVRK